MAPGNDDFGAPLTRAQVDEVIGRAYISKHWTLDPGDIIFTGTPHGVIVGKPKDQQVWLKAGDAIESRIEKLGTLKFTLA